MTEKLSNLSRVLYDKVVGEFLIGNDIGFDGETAIQQFVQNDPLERWEIKLKIRGVVTLVFVFADNDDGTFTLVQPSSVTRVTEEDITIDFNTRVSGVANILLSTEATQRFQGALTPTPTLTRTVTPTPQPTISVTPSLTPTQTPFTTPAVTPTISITPSATPVGQSTLNDYAYSNVTFTTEVAGSNRDIHFRPDGLKMFICSQSLIHAYNLNDAFSIDTASYDGEFSAAAAFVSIAISSDGTKFFGVRTNDDIQDGILTSPWDISTLILGNSWTPTRSDIDHIQVRSDIETQLFIKYTNNATLERRNMIGWDATLIGPVVDTVDLDPLAPGANLINDFIIDPASGNAVYIFRGNGELIKFALNTPWNLNTIVFDGTQSLNVSAAIGQSFSNSVYVSGVTEPSAGVIITNGGNTAELYEFLLAF